MILGRRLADLSIQEKLTRVGMLASATALLTAITAFGLYDLVTFRQDMVRQLSTQAAIVGQNSVSAVLFDDADTAREILASFGADPHVRAAALYDEQGRLFATWVRGGATSLPDVAPSGADDHAFGGDGLMVRRRMFFRGTRVGTVAVESDLLEIRDRMVRYAGILALVFLGAFLAARLTSSRYESAISAPLLSLADTARTVSRDRDFSVRAPPGGRDELGLLVETFNGMLEQIQQRDKELQQARDELEHRVAQRTAELREAQRLAQVGSWSWDLARGIVTWSDEMRRLLALPEDAPIDALLGRVHGDDREAVALALRQASGEGRGFGLDHRVVTEAGTRILHTHAVVAADGEGRPQRVLGTGQDVTERKVAEEEQAALLREQLARASAEAAEVRATLLSDVSAALGASLEPLRTLPQVARVTVPLLADACALLVGEPGTPPALAAVTTELRAALAAALAGASATSLTAADEASLAEATGLARVLVLEVASVQGRMGTFVLGRTHGEIDAEDAQVAQGVADRVAGALENARLYAELRDANRLKDEFLATLSHELRTPLNAIVGWTKLLQIGEMPPPQKERAIATIDRNARALARLIEDILDVSRIVSGKLRLDLQAVDVGSVVLAALEAVRPAAAARSIRLEHPNGGDVAVVADPQRLQQVIWNLLSNAIKFTPVGGVVAIEIAAGADEARIVVTDSGVGIAPAFLPHVFDRFRQADSSSTRAHGGLGLGLAIVRHLVELHGGTVQATSAGAGLGSRFEVVLPLHPASAGAPEAGVAGREIASGPSDASPRLEGVDVLVVDDEADTRELVRVMLERVGAVVRTASSADEAMRLFTTSPSAVLLSDIEMPGGDGYALLQRIRALGAARGGNVPAAALTAYARPEDRMRALRAGFQVHVPKPVQPLELTAVVASLARETARPAAPDLK